MNIKQFVVLLSMPIVFILMNVYMIGFSNEIKDLGLKGVEGASIIKGYIDGMETGDEKSLFRIRQKS